MVLPGPVARINGGGGAEEHALRTAAEVGDGRTLSRPASACTVFTRNRRFYTWPLSAAAAAAAGAAGAASAANN